MSTQLGIWALCAMLLTSWCAAQSDPAVTAELETLENAFVTSLKLQAGQEEAMAKLTTQVRGALESAMNQASKAGKLDDALVFQEEMKWLEANPGKMPRTDEKALFTLKNIRSVYASQLGSLTDAQKRAFKSMLPKLESKLAAYQDELTRAGKLDGALAVKSYRADLEKKLSAKLFPTSALETAAKRDSVKAHTVDEDKIVFEGESFVKSVASSELDVIVQSQTGYKWSNAAQLWWRNPNKGKKMTIVLDPPVTGKFDITVHLTRGQPAWISMIRPGDERAKEYASPSPSLETFPLEWKNVDITANVPFPVSIEFMSEVEGQNFGLDCIVLERKGIRR